MPVMAKKKPATVPLYMRIKKALKELLDAVAEENRRTPSAEVEIALERYFESLGKWPLPKPR